MRVVLDSNVIISGLNYAGNERLVLDLARRERFELYLSAFILQEVARVLVRKFGWPEARAARALRRLAARATVIEPDPPPTVIEGEHPDNRILACAAAATADYLVTGDRRHLLPLVEHEGARIVNAARFLDALEA